MYKIGVIGAGNMGLAIIDGAINCKIFKNSDVAVFDISKERMDLCESKGYTVFKDELDIVNNCQMVLFAVKPQVFGKLLEKIVTKKDELHNKIFITIAAGISIEYIQKYLGYETKIVRVMPNTPLMIGYGASALSKSKSVSNSEFENVLKIFKSMGEAAVIPEEQMNKIIAVNGSSPAYVYYFINCIAKSAKNMGIDSEVAKKLIVQTFIGAAKMVVKTGKEPEDLIRQVCSPGGTTIESIKVFDNSDLFDVINEGCMKCVKRADELSN